MFKYSSDLGCSGSSTIGKHATGWIGAAFENPSAQKLLILIVCWQIMLWTVLTPQTWYQRVLSSCSKDIQHFWKQRHPDALFLGSFPTFFVTHHLTAHCLFIFQCVDLWWICNELQVDMQYIWHSSNEEVNDLHRSWRKYFPWYVKNNKSPDFYCGSECLPWNSSWCVFITSLSDYSYHYVLAI